MLRKYFYIFYFFLITSSYAFAQEEFKKLTNIEQENINATTSNLLQWEILNQNIQNTLRWEKTDQNEENLLKRDSDKYKISKRDIRVKALDRSVTINNRPYPEISHYVPNGYVSDSQKRITTSLRTISKLRFCDGNNFEYKCADGILNIDFRLISTDKFSFNSKYSLQSISNRGTKFGEESSMGFKIAKEVNPNLSISFGGENIIHFDQDIDLGRNFFLIASTHKKLGKINKENPSILFINAGIGSDFYGYKGNGFLFRAPCLGEPNLTGNDKNNCSWGPIGSIALAANDRITFVSEWFGYSYGSGFSIKPLKERNIIFSLYATDFIKGFPKYAKEHCPNNECETRFYGNISLSF